LLLSFGLRQSELLCGAASPVSSHVDRVLYKLLTGKTGQIWLRSLDWVSGILSLKSDQVPGWLSRIATNLFYDELRKQRVSSPLSLDAPVRWRMGKWIEKWR